MRVTVLGSGSAGNATLVDSAGVSILIDAGFSGRDLENRIRLTGLEPDRLTAIVITHDHVDHTRGMGVLARRFGVPLYLTRRTAAACRDLLNGEETVREYASSGPFRIGPFDIRPFVTVHDAVDPVAITVQHLETGTRLGVALYLTRRTAAACRVLLNGEESVRE
ncbi:MAG: MBL fold metallo-hydrolase [Longimicrobiales bacterium]